MTYLLTDPLPHRVWIRNLPFEVETDYRLFVRFEREVFLGCLQPEEFLRSFYQGNLPDDLSLAWQGFLDFYQFPREDWRQGDSPADPQQAPSTSPGRELPYAFAEDDGRIYAAFWQAYGIRLREEKLHWGEFCALFSALCEPPFGKIVGWRMMDLSDVKGREKTRLLALKNAWRIQKPGEESLEQRNAGWVERLVRVKDALEQKGE